MPPLYHLIYLSRLAPDASAACVASIVRASRLRNEQERISGLLVFDGARFCQYLEGPETSVCTLADRIRVDTRNCGFRILHQSVLDGPRLLGKHGLEYALSHDGQLERFEACDGAAAAVLFRDLMPAFDLSPDCQSF